MKKRISILFYIIVVHLSVFAHPVLRNDSLQSSSSSRWKANFSLQTGVHYTTRRQEPNGYWSGNTYLTGNIRHPFVEMGIRVEELSHPLPGYEETKGWGIANMYIKGKYRFIEVTAGDFYEQFGSGLILRSYEDRNLGIDNSIRGGRVAWTPAQWATLKFLVGQQRNHFDRNNRMFNRERGLLWAADLEWNADQWLNALREQDWLLNAGVSWVTKQEDADPITRIIDGKLYRLNQPEQVSAFAARLRLQHKEWELHTEYAYKPDDPNATNGYIYCSGSVAMLTTTYARNGISALIGARRSENFDFRSERTATQSALRINHLQPFTQQQSYTLAALYPYATQPNGEWAFQAEVRYRFKKGTGAGGRYGTAIKLSASHINGIRQNGSNSQWGGNEAMPDDTSLMGTNGYRSRFFGIGKKFFHDFNLEISKKVSPTYGFTLTYMNQFYNRKIIEGHAENGDIIRSNIWIYDGKHKLSHRLSLRTELQYLHTRQAEGEWLFALAECSLLPRFIFSISDQWNIGSAGRHYYMASATGLFGKHRVQLSYGRTRQGINCSGGVCRMMPATHGFYASYHLNL